MGNYNTKTDHLTQVLCVNIMTIHTTGANDTAKKYKLPLSGVAASHEMASWDLEKIRKNSCVIKHVAGERGIDPAVIAAIISRHQIKEEDISEENLRKVTNKLADSIGTMCCTHCDWTKEQQFQGGISTYNGKNVRSCNNIDEYTDGGDYSNDIIARAQWFKTKFLKLKLFTTNV